MEVKGSEAQGRHREVGSEESVEQRYGPSEQVTAPPIPIAAGRKKVKQTGQCGIIFLQLAPKCFLVVLHVRLGKFRQKLISVCESHNRIPYSRQKLHAVCSSFVLRCYANVEIRSSRWWGRACSVGA